jgi:hypothetical protein
MKAVIATQLQYGRALDRTGANGCKYWDDLVELLKLGPSDEATAMDKARNWFSALLSKHQKYPTRAVEQLIGEAMEEFDLSNPKARQAYREAQKRTGNYGWSETRRPPKNILQVRAERAKPENALLH